MTRAYSFLTVKSADDDSREISGTATTPSLDKAGDIVVPTGADFTLPLPLLWQHQHDQPIGHVTHAQATPSGITFRAKLVKIAEAGALKDRLDEAWQSLKSGLVRAVSIGFIPHTYEPLPSGGLKYTRWSWSELSAVTIPANQDATIATVKAIDAADRRSRYAGTRVVKLGSPVSGGTSVADAVLKAAGDTMADIERLKELKDLGPTTALLVRSQAAGVKATDAALAEIRRRLAQIEGRNR